MTKENLTLAWCPCCGYERRIPLFPTTSEYDNDLAQAIKADPLRVAGGLRLSDFKRSNWSVCSHCGLMYATVRPDAKTLANWYPALFREVENRAYDQTPLPEIYVKNQMSFAKEMFAGLSAAGVLNNAQSVMHLRCNAGFLLKEIVSNSSVKNAYGLEYFRNPAKVAADHLGQDRVQVIDTPEPRNPFAQRTFDLLLVEHFLTHAFNLRDYVGYLKSLVAPGGSIVFFNEPDHRLSMRPGHQYSKGVNFFHNQLFTKVTIADFLHSTGLETKFVDHPRGRKWAVADSAMFIVCKPGSVIEVPNRPEEIRSSIVQCHEWNQFRHIAKNKSFAGKMLWTLKRKLARKK